MILYTLACDSGHRFDSWFRDSGAFEDQQARGLVTCLECGSPHVAKTIMAPAVVSRRATRPPPIDGGSAASEPTAAAAERAPPPVDVALAAGRQRELRDLARAFRERVTAQSQDVGANFSKEARRMHMGEIPERQIRGQATLGEARDLIEDGILVLPLPTLPDDMN